MSQFFVSGGTLSATSSSYVARKADIDLLEALRNREFAYVLDSRQKGKSSLMIRTREALEDSGIRTVLLDLQRFGANLSVERWYASLLLAVGEDLKIEDRLLDLWEAQPNAGPMRKFFGALETGLAELDRPVVIFVDEIDYVRSLNFSSDEFFSGIREVYNRRATDGKSHLTFCLLGVATPSELIQDVRITPFNIGKRIELSDFTLAELASFIPALSANGRDGAELVKRIHYWTGGHPYLTQKLASELADQPSVTGKAGVDRMVESLFFSQRARSDEPNLADVSRRVLESPLAGVSGDEARARTLDLYKQIRDGRRIADDDSDPIASLLKLSGLVRILEGYLVVRNRVYFRTFDQRWVESNLPNAELLRQKNAAKKAAARVGLITGSVAAAMGLLTLVAFSKAGEANRLALKLRDSLAQTERESDEKTKVLGQLKAESAAKENALIQVQRESAAKAKTLIELQAEKVKTDQALALAESNARLAKVQTGKAQSQANRAEKQRLEASRQSALARANAARATAQKQIAEGKTAEAKKNLDIANRLVYGANMLSIKTAADAGNWALAVTILNSPAVSKSEFRGWEFRYLKTLLNQHEIEFQGVALAKFSPDKSRILTLVNNAGKGGEIAARKIRIHDSKTGKTLAECETKNIVGDAYFCGNTTNVAYETIDSEEVYVWDTSKQSAQTIVSKGTISSASGKFLILATKSPDVLVSGNVVELYPIVKQLWSIAEIKGARAIGTSPVMEFSPDETQVAMFTQNDSIQLWDIESLSLVWEKAYPTTKKPPVHGKKALQIQSSNGMDERTLQLQYGSVSERKDIKWADNKTLIFEHEKTGFLPSDYYILQSSTGNILSQVTYDRGLILSGRFIKNQDKVLWCSGGSIYSMNTKTGAISTENRAIPEGHGRVTIFDDGTIASSEDAKLGEVEVRGSNSPGRSWQMRGFQSDPLYLEYDSSLMKLLAYESAGIARVWRLNTSPSVTEVQMLNFSEESSRIFFSPNQDSLVHIRVGELERFNLEDGKLVFSRTDPKCSGFTNDGTLYVVPTSEGIEVKRPETGTSILKVSAKPLWTLSGILSPLGRYLVVRPFQREKDHWRLDSTTVYDSGSGKEVLSVSPSDVLHWHPKEESVLVTENLTRAVDAFTGKEILGRPVAPTVYSLKTGKMMYRLPYKSQRNWQFSIEGTLLLDNRIGTGFYFHDALSGKLLSEFLIEDRTIESVKFSPDDKLLATISRNGEGAIFDIKSKKWVNLFLPSDGGFTSFDFSPDQSRIIGMTNGGNIQIFDPVTGLLLLQIKGSETRTPVPEFSKDMSKLLIPGSQDEPTRILFATPKNGKYPLVVTPEGTVLRDVRW